MMRPAPANVRLARALAHKVFDELWLSGRYTREGAYQMMTRHLGRSSHIHIGSMSAADCELLIEAVKNLPAELAEDNYETLERTVISVARFAGRQYRNVDLTALELLSKELRGPSAVRLARYLDHPRTFATRHLRRHKRRGIKLECSHGDCHEQVTAKPNRTRHRRRDRENGSHLPGNHEGPARFAARQGGDGRLTKSA